MRHLAWLALAALVAGCANPWHALDMAPGTPRDEVLARAGRPTAEVPLPGGGQRLQYSWQPMGQHAVMVDLDAGGRLVQVRQVLTAEDFARIQPDAWTRADVLRAFGPPAREDRVASWPGPVLTYRWTDGSDMFYWIYLDAQGVVRRAHPGMEHANSPADRD
ncbi:hypothetical protein [Ramlibacter sp.]|uniref:hypothetical protein n=1 Tax=Ramlibacter sp. TaxID=1917967 RepID=UPI0035B13878